MDDNTPECKEEIRIVYADNVKDAKDKFEKYFEKQSDDYYVYYSVYNISVTEPII